MPPLWALAAIVVLGFNEVMSVLRSPLLLVRGIQQPCSTTSPAAVAVYHLCIACPEWSMVLCLVDKCRQFLLMGAGQFGPAD